MTELISTQPLDAGDHLLLDKFHEEIVRQSDRMDDLAKHLIHCGIGDPRALCFSTETGW